MTGGRPVKPPEETRGGENPGDWQVAESAREAAAAIDAFNDAFLAEEIHAHGSDDPRP
jgi:hypothetical protein